MCHMESDLLTNTCFGTVKFQQSEKIGNQTSFQHSDQLNTRTTHYIIVLFEAIFCRVIVKLAANSNKKKTSSVVARFHDFSVTKLRVVELVCTSSHRRRNRLTM